MFPLDSIDMEKYIFDASKQTWENYISNIKKLLAQSPITTNETIIEEKNNKLDIFDKNIMSDIILYIYNICFVNAIIIKINSVFIIILYNCYD